MRPDTSNNGCFLSRFLSEMAICLRLMRGHLWGATLSSYPIKISFFKRQLVFRSVLGSKQSYRSYFPLGKKKKLECVPVRFNEKNLISKDRGFIFNFNIVNSVL